MANVSARLPRSTPGSLGISAAGIAAFLDAVDRSGLELHSFMLLRHGQVAAEGWWAPYGERLPHMMFSLSKSFTATAIGMAIREGLLSLHDAVLDFFPEQAALLAPSPAFAANRDRLRRLTIRHLLCMGSGHGEDTLGALFAREDGDWAAAFLEAPLVHEPGAAFVYNSGATYMLSAALQKAAGATLFDYLQPRLFAPLGIAGAAWDVCPRGVTTGGWGLRTTTEAIATFGQLYLQRGMWNGQRLLDEEWVREATAAQIGNSSGEHPDGRAGYGYQFWRCRHGAYRGAGAYGQLCVVMPEQDAVLTVTAGTSDGYAVLDQVWEHLLPALEGRPAAGEAYDAGLAERMARLSLAPPAAAAGGSLVGDAAAGGDGRTYVVADGAGGMKELTFRFGANEMEVVVSGRHGAHAIRFGFGEWAAGVTRVWDGQARHVAASAGWTGPGELQLCLRAVETPFMTTVRCRFDGDRLELRQTPNLGGDSLPPLRLPDAFADGVGFVRLDAPKPFPDRRL